MESGPLTEGANHASLFRLLPIYSSYGKSTLAPMKIFLVFAKINETESRVIRIKATEFMVEDSGSRLVFEDGGKQIAMFNMNELIGFVEAEHIVN